MHRLSKVHITVGAWAVYTATCWCALLVQLFSSHRRLISGPLALSSLSTGTTILYLCAYWFLLQISHLSIFHAFSFHTIHITPLLYVICAAFWLNSDQMINK